MALFTTDKSIFSGCGVQLVLPEKKLRFLTETVRISLSTDQAFDASLGSCS